MIDINLPYHFSFWNHEYYTHQRDLGAMASDSEIWAYARTNHLTIVTKDRDYSDRMLLSTPPPRVIHLRIGNMKLRQFYAFMEQHWPAIQRMSASNKLVYVYADRLEGIE